jgi:SAM-dependent methyltransferase
MAENLINLDIYPGEHVDILSSSTSLPFKDESFDLIFSQEVLEHVDDNQGRIREVCRVLKPRGTFYCHLPFIIGCHSGPNDYWRYTKEGICAMFRRKEWQSPDCYRVLGHGSDFYRTFVEFMAVNTSIVWNRLYMPTKALFSILTYPLQWLDLLTHLSNQEDRISGGYAVIVKKASK